MPPTPKPPGQRRRGNTDAPQWRTLPAEGRTGKVPTLPGASKLPKEARDWWQVVWRSPMAAVYLDADVPALGRGARLVAKECIGRASASELGELRQIEDRYGLSPLARRRLQWEIEQASDQPPVREESPVARQRRLRLAS